MVDNVTELFFCFTSVDSSRVTMVCCKADTVPFNIDKESASQPTSELRSFKSSKKLAVT